VCTPFEYAMAKERELREGVWLAPSFTAAGIADALHRFIATRATQPRVQRDVYGATRSWGWDEVGSVYLRAFRGGKTRRAADAS